MTQISTEQQAYLRHLKKHRMIVQFFRFFLLLLFLGLWEISSGNGWIDSFIFSSPSRIFQCFLTMTKDRFIFPHIRITFQETMISFLLVTFFGILLAILLWSSQKCSEILDPYLVVLNKSPEVRPCPASDRMAGCHQNHHHRRRNVGGHLRMHLKSVHRISLHRSGKDLPDLYPGRHKTSGADQSRHPLQRRLRHQCHESQYRTLSRGCDHRRISGCKTGPWLSDHLCQPDFQNGMAPYQSVPALPDVCSVVQPDQATGATCKPITKK